MQQEVCTIDKIWVFFLLCFGHRRSQEFCWGRGCPLLVPEMLTNFFLLVILLTLWNIPWIKRRTLLRPIKMWLLPSEGGALSPSGGAVTTYPINSAPHQKIISRPGGCIYTHCTPWLHAYGFETIGQDMSVTKLELCNAAIQRRKQIISCIFVSYYVLLLDVWTVKLWSTLLLR